MGPLSCQPLCPGSALSSASLGMDANMESPGISGPLMWDQAEPSKLLTEADFPIWGDPTLCQQVQEEGGQGRALVSVSSLLCPLT